MDKLSYKSISIIIFILCVIVIANEKIYFNNHFYKNIKEIKSTSNLDVLVNKNNKLPKEYIPNNLTRLELRYSNSDKFLRNEAKIAFEALAEDAYKLGYQIIVTSAYRSYEYQEKLYNSYIVDEGIIYADSCSARPGHSEHQTGLAIDVMGSNGDYNSFEDSIEFTWMKENSYKYGFILRYPKDKVEITGFKYEPWHYRYVGNLATYLYKNNLTLDEYKLKD